MVINEFFPVLISYFYESKGESTVEHYGSVEYIVVNGETLFNEIARFKLDSAN